MDCCLQHCPVILTDHNPVVLKVLQRNADLNKGDFDIRCQPLALMKWDSGTTTISSLAWGFSLGSLGSEGMWYLSTAAPLQKVSSHFKNWQCDCAFWAAP